MVNLHPSLEQPTIRNRTGPSYSRPKLQLPVKVSRASVEVMALTLGALVEGIPWMRVCQWVNVIIIAACMHLPTPWAGPRLDLGWT